MRGKSAEIRHRIKKKQHFSLFFLLIHNSINFFLKKSKCILRPVFLLLCFRLLNKECNKQSLLIALIVGFSAERSHKKSSRSRNTVTRFTFSSPTHRILLHQREISSQISGSYGGDANSVHFKGFSM